MTRAERAQGIRDLLLMFWGLSICLIPAPITARPGQSNSGLLVVLGIPLALVLVAGTHRLLFPAAPARWRWAVHLGLAVTIFFLLFAPAAFRISFASLKYKPMWLVTTTVGTVAGLAYLFLYVKQFVRAKPPNTSPDSGRDA